MALILFTLYILHFLQYCTFTFTYYNTADVMGLDINIQPIYYKYGTGYTRPFPQDSKKVVCQFCDVIVSKAVLYRHRIVCAGLPAEMRAEASAIATRFSSQRAIRQKLSKFVHQKYGGRRIAAQYWPVALVKYIKDQVKHLPKDTGHNVMDYFDVWKAKDYSKMPVLRNPDFYVKNNDCAATG